VRQEKYLTQAGVLRKAFLAAALTVLGLELLAHSAVLAGLFSPQYLPHRYCYLQQPWLVWTNVTMDGLIAISYGSIFLSLFWVAGQLRSIQDLRPIAALTGGKLRRTGNDRTVWVFDHHRGYRAGHKPYPPPPAFHHVLYHQRG
jgi:hypothetical protein